MADFSISHAAFTGFRIVRERPMVVVVWGVVQLIISLGLSALLVATTGPTLMQMTDMGSSAADPTRILALFQALLPTYGLLLLFSLVFYPALYAAMNRAVLRPGEQAFGYLRLGGDEMRQLALLLLFSLIGLVAYIVLIILAILPVAVIIGAMGAGGGRPAFKAIAALMPLIIVIVVFCVIAVFAVRLSLASAITFAARRVSLFDSWTMTRGRFWPLLGTYLLVALLALLVWALVFVISMAAATITGGGANAASLIFRPDMSSLGAYFTPARIVYLVLSAGSSALIWPLVLTPPATIYASLASAYGYPGGGEAVADVFA